MQWAPPNAEDVEKSPQPVPISEPTRRSPLSVRPWLLVASSVAVCLALMVASPMVYAYWQNRGPSESLEHLRNLFPADAPDASAPDAVRSLTNRIDTCRDIERNLDPLFESTKMLSIMDDLTRDEFESHMLNSYCIETDASLAVAFFGLARDGIGPVAAWIALCDGARDDRLREGYERIREYEQDVGSRNVRPLLDLQFADFKAVIDAEC